MSEFQYYDFRSIDKPLSKEEQNDISNWSSRVKPTNYGATFVYHYGDFSRDEITCVARYFDAMFYIANWGSTRLLLKFPQEVVDSNAIKQYRIEDEVCVFTRDEYVFVDIYFRDEEGYGWLEENNWLDELIELRSAIIQGDYRCLYLAWLQTAILKGQDVDEDVDEDFDEDFDVEILEPPVPPNFAYPNTTLENFMSIFKIGNDTLTLATEVSDASILKEKPVDMEDMLRNLPTKEKDDFLLRLLSGEILLDVKLRKRLTQLTKENEGQKDCVGTENRRSVKELVQSIKTVEERRKEEDERKQEQERLARLDKTASQESVLWEKIYENVTLKNPKAYDEVATILKGLKELAVHRQKTEEFKKRIEDILNANKRLSGLKARIIKFLD